MRTFVILGSITPDASFMKHLPFFLFTFFALASAAQNKTVLIFDLVNGRVDSLVNIQYDTTKLSDKTNFSVGKLDSLIETLEQVPPDSNVYPNSHFTKKKRASVDYDLTKYPVRTSVKLFAFKNDSLLYNCSGSLISRRHVLTAGHCVVEISGHNTLSVDSLYICPVFDNGESNGSFPCSWVQKIFVFKVMNLMDSDFAVLLLQDKIGDQTGWISIGFNSVDSLLKDGFYYKFSYPGKTIPEIDSVHYNGDTLYYNYGLVDIVEDDYIGINNASGIPGESGSSITMVENNENYTSYGVLSFSHNLRHCRLKNWSYYSLEYIIHNDLVFGTRDEYQANSFSIFPNPCKEKFWINKLSPNENMEISVCDIWGRQVLKTSITYSKSSVDVRELPDGMYLLVLKTGKSEFTRKLIKQGK